MKLGYYPSERETGQDVLVSLAVHIKIDRTLEDCLEGTLNYEQLFHTIDQVLLGKDMKLIETAVEALGHSLLHSFPIITHLTVTIEKPLIPGGLTRGATLKICENYTRSHFSAHTE